MTTNYAYNDLDQVTNASVMTYNYDGRGDLTKITNYTYNAADQLTSAGAITYNYDARGNQTKITNGSNVTNYTYNSADQLIGVSAPGVSASYAYDADGRRVKQTLGSAVTNFLWDEASAYGDVVYEYNNSGTALANYVLAGTQLISQTKSGTTSYFLQDGQGSTRALTNNSGGVINSYNYTAFGELYNSTATGTNYLYTGQQFDTSTGLYSLRARYYNPALGRLLSQDTYPVNFGNPVELNRYVYAANSPINLSDPTGNTAIPEYGILLSGVVGGVAGAISAKACGQNALAGFVIGAALGLSFGTGFAAFYAFSPGLAVATGVGVSGIQAGVSVYDFFAHGMTLCQGTNAALSLIFFGLSMWGANYYINNEVLGGLGKFGVPDEFMSPFQTGQWRNWSNTEIAKWIVKTNAVNPSYSRTNCYWCVLATDQFIAGSPMVAPKGDLMNIRDIQILYSPYYGGTQVESAIYWEVSPSNITSALIKAGNGSRGIVLAWPEAQGIPGHAFNVINDNGTILAVDAQKNIIVPFEVYANLFDKFRFLFTGY